MCISTYSLSILIRKKPIVMLAAPSQLHRFPHLIQADFLPNTIRMTEPRIVDFNSLVKATCYRIFLLHGGRITNHDEVT